MYAIISQRNGSLEWQEVDTPVPAVGEVLIKVAAAGVNRADLLQREGLYPPPFGVSTVMGLEVSGTIAQLGEGVVQSGEHSWEVGNEVCALLAGGGYAEYVTVPIEQVMPIPAGVTLQEAASLPEAYATVWQTLQDIAALTKGETLLVHGGASGIGSAAIQCARLWGVKVLTTVSTGEKCQFCEGLGAHPVNYRFADFVTFAKAATEDRGVDVILDMVGGDYISRNFHAAAVGARIVQIAFLAGAKAEVNFAPLLMKRLSLTGSTLRSQPVAVKGAIVSALRDRLWPEFATGGLRVVVDQYFPVQQADFAHDYMKSGQNIGKLVLTFD